MKLVIVFNFCMLIVFSSLAQANVQQPKQVLILEINGIIGSATLIILNDQ